MELDGLEMMDDKYASALFYTTAAIETCPLKRIFVSQLVDFSAISVTGGWRNQSSFSLMLLDNNSREENSHVTALIRPVVLMGSVVGGQGATSASEQHYFAPNVVQGLPPSYFGYRKCAFLLKTAIAAED